MRLAAYLTAAVTASTISHAEIPPNLTAEGIPPASEELKQNVARYLEFRSASFQSWHPQRQEMLIATRFADTMQLHLVKMAGGMRKQLTFGSEPISRGSFQPKAGNCFVYAQDVGGGEFYQLYRYDLADGRATLLTDGKSRNTGPKWARSGKWLAYTSTRRNGKDNDVRVINPQEPASDREMYQVSGGGWSVLDWSHDEQKLLLGETISANESNLHILDLRTGKAQRITPKSDEKVMWDGGQFAADDHSIFTVTDQGAEFRQLAQFDFEWRKTRVLTETIPWDIEEFDLSPNGRTIAAIANVEGSSELKLIDAASGKFKDTPRIPVGVMSGLEWHEDGTRLGFSLNSAKSPTDAWVYDLSADRLTRWTESETGGLDASTFSEPELVKIKSFDGLPMSGFLYRPDAAKFRGRRPCIVLIHGGPEGQSQPTFLGRYNYFLNELGIAVFLPNVRGSSGYGKTFLTLDNGMKREDSVRDIGAFLDALAKDNRLAGSRFAVTGGSYGGYMTLASMIHYGDKLRCGVDSVGISNFVSFLNNTQDYRRDLRRVEYGDERDPAMAEFFAKISPTARAGEIKRPLFIVQGKNDPRVPVMEAQQMAEAVRKAGGTVWYLEAADEGHGFSKKKNVDFLFVATVQFFTEHLLK
jgi:dipeptidyl aminopeptidase/acylaminoacyl peptidase